MESKGSFEEQSRDAGHGRSQLVAKLAEDAKVIEELKGQLADQIRVVNFWKSGDIAAARSSGSSQQNLQIANEASATGDRELATSQAKLAELQKTMEAAIAQRDENARQTATLEVKVNELTQLVKNREQSLDQRDAEVVKGQELLEHDHDIRELMSVTRSTIH